MPELPDLPEGWSPGSSAAYLLLGVAIIDGVLHDEEVQGVYERLTEHVGEAPEVLHGAVERAWFHLQAVMGAGGMSLYLDSLEQHCWRVRNSYPASTVRALLDDLVAVAEGDGHVASAEIAYIAAVSEHLGLDIGAEG